MKYFNTYELGFIQLFSLIYKLKNDIVTNNKQLTCNYLLYILKLLQTDINNNK